MIDLEHAFAALPPPPHDSGDPIAARRVFLRARIATIVDDEQRRARVQRLRMVSSFASIFALDAIALLLIASNPAPLLVTVAGVIATHTAATLTMRA
jgi:hypothetical protein